MGVPPGSGRLIVGKGREIVGSGTFSVGNEIVGNGTTIVGRDRVGNGGRGVAGGRFVAVAGGFVARGGTVGVPTILGVLVGKEEGVTTAPVLSSRF